MPISRCCITAQYMYICFNKLGNPLHVVSSVPSAQVWRVNDFKDTRRPNHTHHHTVNFVLVFNWAAQLIEF